ncbi:MAG: hypothetical protein JKY95_17920 [Planctomycetaceae bacterium]|nr:hypothetical protein [Planctomycetaceae bacterium]
MTHRKDQRLINSARRKSGQKNTIPKDQPFVWFTRSMLESVAFKALSGNAHKTLSRLLIEHMAHAGTENGNLICTYNNFADYGVRRQSIATAVRQLEYMGFIRVEKGWAYSGEHLPSKYRITWLPSADGTPATNEWKSITSVHVEAFHQRAKNNNRLAREQMEKRKEEAKQDLPSNVVQMMNVREVGNVST